MYLKSVCECNSQILREDAHQMSAMVITGRGLGHCLLCTCLHFHSLSQEVSATLTLKRVNEEGPRAAKTIHQPQPYLTTCSQFTKLLSGG